MAVVTVTLEQPSVNRCMQHHARVAAVLVVDSALLVGAVVVVDRTQAEPDTLCVIEAIPERTSGFGRRGQWSLLAGGRLASHPIVYIHFVHLN